MQYRPIRYPITSRHYWLFFLSTTILHGNCAISIAAFHFDPPEDREGLLHFSKWDWGLEGCHHQSHLHSLLAGLCSPRRYYATLRSLEASYLTLHARSLCAKVEVLDFLL